MSEETATVTEPVDDAKIVNDDPVADEEKSHDDLVAKVAKRLEQPDESEEAPFGETPQSEKPGEDKPPEKPPKGEGEEEKAGLSQELQNRVKGAGLTEDLSQRLQQSGQLEETLAAFDRSMIEHVQSRESEDSATADSKETPKDETPPKDQDSPTGDVPALDPDVYDEGLVKRDAYQQKRIDTLEKELEGFRSQVDELIEGQQGGFDEWFDGRLTDLGADTSDNEKCQAVFKAYGAMCAAFGTNANARDKAMVDRAYAAMYPQDVFKQKQRQTVDRLRDAEGKFLSSSKPRGGPPPKGATDEEVHDQLVSDVDAYLEKKGVQMSGY